MEKTAKRIPIRKTLTDYLRLWFKWFLDPLGGFFNRLGITPNMMTMLGLIGNSVGAYFLARGEMLTGGIFVLLMTPIDALDGTEFVIRMRTHAQGMAFDITVAAVVAQIEKTVRSHREPVGPAAAIGKETHFAVGRDARAALIAQLHQSHGAIGADDRSFREAQARRKDFHFLHDHVAPLIAPEKQVCVSR